MTFSKKTRKLFALAAMLPLAAGLTGCFQDEPVAGTKLSVTNFANNPRRNSVLVVADDTSIMVPEAGSAGDPTMHGGFLQLLNPATHESDVYSLPAENWKALPAPAQGYSYVDVHHDHGPCEIVTVTAGERLVASCRGEDVKFSLDAPQQRALEVNLVVGTVGGARYCASFGGQVMRDVSASNMKNHVGSFLAMDAPAPEACMPSYTP
jgi:hypothetical protein